MSAPTCGPYAAAAVQSGAEAHTRGDDAFQDFMEYAEQRTLIDLLLSDDDDHEVEHWDWGSVGNIHGVCCVARWRLDR